MKPKSEFQSVLEKLLNVEVKTEATQPQPQPQKVKVDFVFGLPEFQIKYFNPKVESKYKASKEEVKINFTKTELPKRELKKPKLKIDPKIEPIKRIKRKLTFDQKVAVENFSKLGEKSIDDQSTLDEIKSAYRRLAKKFHPDINPNGAREFKIISRDYKKLIQGF